MSSRQEPKEQPAMPTGSRSWRPFLLAASATAIVLVGAGFLLTASWLEPGQRQVLSDSLFVLCPLPGVAYCLHVAALTTGRLRGTWLCFAGTLASWAVGNVFWFYYHLLDDYQPFPTVGDAFYVLALVLAGIGLVLFPTGRRGGGARARLLLDGLTVGCALLFVSDVLVLHEVVGAMGTGLAAWVYLTYPVADVVLASLVVLLLTRSPAGGRVDLVLVATGLLAYATTDTAYALLSARGEFAIGTPLDLGWIAGYLLVGLAALTPAAVSVEHRSLRSASTNTAGAVLVYGTTAIALLVGLHDRVDDVPEYLLGGSLVFLLSLRLVLLTRDNRELHQGLERKVAERTEELARILRRQERILSGVGEGIYGVDETGHITFVNPAAARLLGHDLESLIGRDVHTALHAQHAASPVGEDATSTFSGCHVFAAITSGEVVRRSDESYLRADGRLFPVELTAAPIQDPSGVRGAVVVFTDITARLAVERMKDEFISVVSHELRTPLTAIRGSLGLLDGGRLGELSEGAKRMVSIAMESSERLTRLINDILDLERMESGGLPMHLGTHDVADILHAAVRSVLPLAEEADVTLLTEDAAGSLHGDADRIVQAVTNLLANAVKFSPRGRTVTLAASSDGAHVAISVLDQGRGIPEHKLESIFDRFRQVDSSDSREKGGTGLGLAITKTIVERHGGRIWVESQLGRGSSFRFTVPTAPQPPDSGTTVCDGDAAPGRDGHDMTGGRLVEELRDHPADTLERRGV